MGFLSIAVGLFKKERKGKKRGKVKGYFYVLVQKRSFSSVL